MCKHRRVRGFAVFPKILSNDSCDSHSDTNETVLVNTRPDDIEPSQPTSRRSPSVATTMGEPVDR
jgi:protein tyrosine phosphatase (PTP) superfamily phosphohydrolase (DUF442 family)